MVCFLQVSRKIIIKICSIFENKMFHRFSTLEGYTRINNSKFKKQNMLGRKQYVTHQTLS